jgi:Lon protease-like protein
MTKVFRKLADLPDRLRIFPLGGAILFPGGVLPLNVFEPRYLNMVDDALASDRLIGMIQPSGREDRSGSPGLTAVGCAGRISSFQETDDGRYLISLDGVCRFRVAQEIPSRTPYRLVETNWREFQGDLSSTDLHEIGDDTNLLEALEGYLARTGLNADWRSIREAPIDALINSLSSGCPFSIPEKQALLEAPSLKERYSALMSLLVMERPGHGGGYVQ